MAVQGKGSGERFSQILIVLITAVVGPIAVWYTTNPNSPINDSRTTPPALSATFTANPMGIEVAQATVVSPVEGTDSFILPATETTVTASPTSRVQATSTPTSTITVTTTPTLSASATLAVPTKPSGLLPAGSPVVVDDLSLLVANSDVSLDNDLLRLQVHLTNQSASQQWVTYSPNSISIRDNTGKNYAFAYGDGKTACKKPSVSMDKTIMIEPGKELVLQPLSAKEVDAWCLRDKDSVLPFFAGPLTSGAHTLTITFNGLGPFKGFSIEINL